MVSSFFETNESADTSDTLHEATAITGYNNDLSFIEIPEKCFSFSLTLLLGISIMDTGMSLITNMPLSKKWKKTSGQTAPDVVLNKQDHSSVIARVTT